jgi:hypothetical protein
VASKEYNHLQRVLLCLTNLFGNIFFRGIYPDESTSAYVFRKQYKRWISFVNWLFRDPLHCETAYKSEHEGIQNAPEYRK